MRGVGVVLVALVGCAPIEGEGVSVALLTCVDPVFTLDSNYCADTFEVEGIEGRMWRVFAGSGAGNDLASLCISELTTGLSYGGSVMSGTADPAAPLLNGETYTYAASFESTQEMPDSWSGEFVYDCPSAVGN